MTENHGCLRFLEWAVGWNLAQSDVEAYISFTADKKLTKIYK